MVKIKKNTDLNKVFFDAEINISKVEKVFENEIIDVAITKPEFQTAMRKKIIKHKILSQILKHILEVDFSLISENTKSRTESEIVKKNVVNDVEKVTIILEYLLHVTEELGFSLVMENGISFLYNGEHYETIEIKLLKAFLGEVANRCGISLYKARSGRFIEELYSQFSHSAAISYTRFDQNIKINLSNGTLQLEGDNFELKTHNREDFFKYKLSFNYDPHAEAPLFSLFLDTVLPDKDSQNVLMEYLGYILTKNLKLEKILIILGTGSNGKSVLFDVINALLGADNVSTISMNNLCDTSGYYRPGLATKLLNYTNEFGGKIDLQIFKKLVSGEPIDGRLPFGHPITIVDYCKFIINTNNLPNVEHSHAFFRRQLVVPFKVTIDESKKDIHLAKKIINNELSGVLNLILLGLRRLITQDGFSVSDEINKEIDKYRLESNTVSQFLEDEGWEKSATNKVRRTYLYKEYEVFCKENNLRICTGPNFSKRLEGLGFVLKRKGTNNFTEVYCQKKEDSVEIINPNNINSILDIFKK